MNLNPEFQRQLYLECSQARLVGIPLVLGCIFTLSYFIDGYHLGSATTQTALILFMLITLLWGARQSIDSIVEEYRDRTWDTQRLSALGPWSMTWGKLFGSTVMVWYAATLCLLVYSLATDNQATLPLLLFYSICAGLLAQNGGLLLGLLAVQRGQSKNSSIFLVAIVGFLVIAPWLTELASPSSFIRPLANTYWYTTAIDSQLFHQVSLLLAIFWCGLGNYRLMMQELGIRTMPWVWLGFSIFMTVYLGGFIPNIFYTFSLAAFLVCTGLTYLGVMVERNDAMRIKRLLMYFSQGNWQRGLEELPIWWLSFILTLPAALQLSLSSHPLIEFSATFHFYPLALTLILLRDCALYVYFCYGKNPQRALTLSLLTGVLLYGIIPGIFKALGQTGLASLFFPLLADSATGALICALLQTGFVMQLLYRRWKKST
jgi:hypothetical protein